jgi:nitrogen fixation/metabolism regulation signal transduction histidine kinase
MFTFFKQFRVQVTLRILLFSATVYVFFSYLLSTNYYATIFVTAIFMLYQVYSLIRYVEKINHHLNRFLLAMRYDDFSTSFPGTGLGTSFQQLFQTFNQVLGKVRQSRAEKEEHYRYLQTIIQHVGIGLVAFRSDGGVDIINNAAKRLLKVPRLKNLQGLKHFSSPLVEALLSLKAGDKTLVKIDGEDLELALHATEFRLKDQKYTLVSLQNIQGELQEKEMEAWQNLIRVLTHEIMNSMTPITSMADTVLGMLDAEPGPDTLSDIRDALKTIHKRSLGLSDFVQAYRNLTLIPRPQFKIFAIGELFSRVEKLLENKLAEKEIAFAWRVEPHTLELTADPGLTEQVLINLILNAIDALTESSMKREEPRIQLTGEMDDSGRVVLRVADNGPGIAKEALPKVFIPFFSTRKKGSGIGLSLSRQIMKLHKGIISVQSEPDVKTTFTLRF